ncbi:glycosyltransferase family 4 protein [Rhodococcus jostii]
MSDSESVVDVLHIGIVGDYPGGMAQVVNGYLDWNFSRCEINAVASTSGRRDPLMPFRFINAVRRLIGFTSGTRKKVVVVHLSEGGSFIREGMIVCFARLLGIPAIAHLHGANFGEFSSRFSWLTGFVLRRATGIMVLTDEAERIVRCLAPGVAEIRRARNAVSQPSSIVSKEKKVVFCGELSHRKGIDTLLAAWARIDRRDWELQLAGPDLIGIGPKPGAGVSYCGPLPHHRVLDLQDRAAVAVLPSRDEALPMFLIEAMARGCAVVSTRVGQIAELVSADCGRLVEPGDVDALVESLSLLIDDDVLRDSCGQSARDRVRSDYSMQVVGADLDQFWFSVANNSRSDSVKWARRGKL